MLEMIVQESRFSFRNERVLVHFHPHNLSLSLSPLSPLYFPSYESNIWTNCLARRKWDSCISYTSNVRCPSSLFTFSLSLDALIDVYNTWDFYFIFFIRMSWKLVLQKSLKRCMIILFRIYSLNLFCMFSLWRKAIVFL
jgi:hypothetical protein